MEPVKQEVSQEMKIKLPEVTCSVDYPWTLKSTTAERGEVLLSIARSWTGDDHNPEGYDPEWVEAIAKEQVVDLLTAVQTHCGNAGLLRVLTDVMATLNDDSDGYTAPTA